MTDLEVNINSKSLLRYVPSLRNELTDEIWELVIRSFSWYIKDLYYDHILEGMNDRRYKGRWEPSDEGYLSYLGVTPKGDLAALIKEALEITKAGYVYIIRIDPKVKYPETHIPLVTVLRAIDRGTTKFNARPIFRKCKRYIEGNMRALWRGFLIVKGVL